MQIRSRESTYGTGAVDQYCTALGRSTSDGYRACNLAKWMSLERLKLLINAGSLTWEHIKELLAEPDPEVRDHFLGEISQRHLTCSELHQERKKLRPEPPRRTRPSVKDIPGAVISCRAFFTNIEDKLEAIDLYVDRHKNTATLQKAETAAEELEKLASEALRQATQLRMKIQQAALDSEPPS